MRHLGHALASKSSCFLLVLGLVLLAPATEVRAGLDKKSTAEAKKATQLYKQGSYEEAANLFLQLSLDNPGMPVFVRNLGACYYYLRRPEPAMSNLREYLLKKKDIDPQDRQEVETWIKEMDELRRGGGVTGPKAPAEAPAAPPEPAIAPLAPGVSTPIPVQPMPPAGNEAAAASPSSPTGSGTAAPAHPVASEATIALQPAPPSKRGHTTAAWLVGGLGVVALAGGGVCTFMALSNFSDVEKKYDPGKESDGKTFATLQWVGYGVGAAALITAVILGASGGDSSHPVALLPSLQPGHAGAVLSGRF